MTLDLKTIFATYFITNALIALVMFLLWRQYRRRFEGLDWLLVASVLHALSLLLFTLREVLSDFWSIVIANLLFSTWALSLYLGLTRFVGVRRRQIHNYILLACLAVGWLYFTYVQPDVNARVLLHSFAVAVFMAQSAHLLLLGTAPGLRHLTRQAGWVLVLYLFITVFRVADVLWSPLPREIGLFDANLMHTASTLAYYLLAIGLAFNLGILVVNRLQADLQRHEEEHLRSEAVLQARLRLMEYANDHTITELLQATLDELEKLTGSTIGFYHFVAGDQRELILQSWSSNTLASMCTAEGEGLHYDIDLAGVWADAARQRSPVIHNDYRHLEHRKGMPKGHAVVRCELVVPVLRGEKICAILGVGNKPDLYDQRDVEVVSLLADLSWDITERKRAVENLLSAERFSTAIVNALSEHLAILDENGVILSVNQAWREFAQANTPNHSEAGLVEGANYLAVCDAASGNDAEMAWQMAAGIRAVMSGQQSEFLLEYPCDTPTEKHWFAARVTCFPGPGPLRLVVAHENITGSKRVERALRLSSAQLLANLENTPNVAVQWYDEDGRVQYWNPASENLYGWSAAEAAGKTLEELQVHSPAEMVAFLKVLAEIKETGKPVGPYEAPICHRDGRQGWVEATTFAIPVERGQLGFVCMDVDVTERKQSAEKIRAALNERETLLRELHHRTKNNMGVIIALLEMQAEACNDERLKQAFMEAENRIVAMSLVHRKLYEANDLSRINLAEYIDDLISLLMQSYFVSSDQVIFMSEMQAVFVLIDTAMPCGLILTELISNTLKHAFPDGRKGAIAVHLRRDEAGQIELKVTDDGVGLPDGFDPRRNANMGLQNVLLLGERQLRAKVTFGRPPGFACTLTFKDDLYQPRV